jgi:tetratricopeptide (TPR) repeat protein
VADESRVQQLLDDISGTGCTPEEVCGACPELVPEVRRRWQQMRIVAAELDALFPALGSAPDADISASWHADTDSLRIPGYEVQALLGRGGMGLVYQARHLRLNRLVALKMLITGAYAGPQERARFQREAEAVASLRHANVVHVYDVGEHNGWPYFTMELLEGGSLAQALAGTPKPARQAAALLTTLAEAVQAAHEAGIVHRDLKPANILLTAEGIPKVADFGLARHCDGGLALTLSGARIGTPSYMAPEQVIGKSGAIGPATDIYALGAVLYEMLTGRPPFRGETAAETERQLIDDAPVAPSRFNTKVPRDLETICLKCLYKEPERRYISATALADDLRRFGEGRAIQARPLSRREQLWRWGRRNPTGAALLVTALALIGLASGGALWLVEQRAERREEVAWRERELRNEVGTAVSQAASFRKSFHFHEARQLLQQTRLRAERAGADDLCRRLDQVRFDLDLAEHLDTARIEAATLEVGRYDPAAAEPLYASAFSEAGLGREGADIEAVAEVVRQSAVRAEIVAALDGWASITPDRSRRAWLLAVARGADPHPTRDRLRQPELWQNGAQLTRFVQESKVAELSPQLATALGRVARESGGDAVALLSAAQARFPQDFWLNRELGWALYQVHRSDEALSYYRAALALRPKTSAVHNGIGAVLHDMGRMDEAIGHLQEALRLDPENVTALTNLAHSLNAKGQMDKAIGHLQQAVRIEPKSAFRHSNLGLALRDKGRLDEATEHFQQALGIEPRSALYHHNLGMAVWGNGRLDDGIVHLQQAVNIEPKSALYHGNLGIALRDKGRLDDAIGHFQQALSIDPTFALIHDNLGLAMRYKGRLDEAITHFQQAVRLNPRLVIAQTDLGTSLYDVARDAVRAADSQGSDDARLGEPARADKRRQALDWLRALLELTTKLQIDRTAEGQSLTTWQTDPALASVREPAALVKLPDAERQQWQRFWADVGAQVSADPMEQGRVHAARRQWDRAAADYARALTRGPTDHGHFWFEYAALLLLSGDRPGYARACAHMIETHGKEGGPRAYHVARARTLSPDAVAEVSPPGRLAEKELRESAQEFWSLTEQGALAYRAGRFQQSVPFLEESLRADSRSGNAVLNWLWLSLANQRLGKAEEARLWLDKAQAWLDQYGDRMPPDAEEAFGLHLHNWLEAHVLRREAEALIPPKGPRSDTNDGGPGSARR